MGGVNAQADVFVGSAVRLSGFDDYVLANTLLLGAAFGAALFAGSR